MKTEHKPFSKTFNSERFRQIVAIKTENDDGDYSIRVFTQPHPDLSVCHLEPSWPCGDSDEEIDKARAERDLRFDEFDENYAEQLAEKFVTMVENMTGEVEEGEL
jgi:hypothetical protein